MRLSETVSLGAPKPKGHPMKKLVVATLAATALAGAAFTFAAAAAPPDAPPPPGDMRGMADHGALMLDAHLAGMKAALKLTPDQEKNWAPFEAAVREAAKARVDEMRAMHEDMHGGDRASPIERMTMMSDGLAKASAQLKAIADAAKPLFDSLDETQKHHFGPLLASLREHGPQGGPMMERGDHHGPDEEPK